MGLDAYVRTIDDPNNEYKDIIEDEKTRVLFDYDSDNFWYWRKDYLIHDCMYKAAKEKGYIGDGNDFNCVLVRIDQKDLDAIKKKYDAFTPKESTGRYMKNNALSFCAKAKEKLEEGKHLYYDSWW